MDNHQELLDTYKELNSVYKTRDTEHLNRVFSQKWLIVFGFSALSIIGLSVVFTQYKITGKLSQIENQNQQLEAELRDSKIEELTTQIKSLELAIKGDEEESLKLEIRQVREELRKTKSLEIEECDYFLGVIKTNCQQIKQ